MANEFLKNTKLLSAWERKVDPKAPLSEKMKDSIINLSAAVSDRPLPELPSENSVRPMLNDRSLLNNPLLTGKSEEFKLSEGFASLNMGLNKVETTQEFLSWFNKIESEIDLEEEFSYRNHTEELDSYKQQCESLLEEVTNALQHLTELQKQYMFVSNKTKALHEACEQSLRDQTELVNTAEDVSNKLSYFNELDRICHHLNSPAVSVTNETFIPMLNKLDDCVAYIKSRPYLKESNQHMARCKQCLSKALTLINNFVVTTLQTTTQQVQHKKDPDNSSSSAFTLFYGKFRANAPKIKPLMEQIEDRIDKNKSPAYGALLGDCHQCYFAQREFLLAPSIIAAINELAKQHSRDHCALVRSGCTFMVHVCQDEHQLYQHFFSKATNKLDLMLESLCISLYDVLRPLIIHVNHLETLAELCSILKNEMIEDHVHNNSGELGAFEVVAKQMLEDVQERLVYRTHIYIQTDILGYRLAAGDLAYPEKLEMMESIAASLKEEAISRQNSVSSSNENQSQTENENSTDTPLKQPELPLVNTPSSPADLHGMWYPTVRRTLVCLSKLYRCIDRTIFQGLSQEALYCCVQSLIAASQAITTSKTPLDGSLFLIKHLLILREQIAPFHVDFSVKETLLDFSTMKDAAYGLLGKTSKLFALNSNNSLLEFLINGTPQVIDYYLDSKREVDNQLKNSCEEFIQTITNTMIADLSSFLTKATVVVHMGSEEGVSNPPSLRQQPFANPDKVKEVVSASYRQIKATVAPVLRSMSLYLANKDTEYILFKPIKANVQQAFTQLQTILNENYSEEDQLIIACPSLEQVNLLMAATGT